MRVADFIPDLALVRTLAAVWCYLNCLSLLAICAVIQVTVLWVGAAQGAGWGSGHEHAKPTGW